MSARNSLNLRRWKTNTDRQTPRRQLRCVKHYMVSHVKNHVPLKISLASTRSYVLSLAHGKNLARSRSSRFSPATVRSRCRLQV